MNRSPQDHSIIAIHDEPEASLPAGRTRLMTGSDARRADHVTRDNVLALLSDDEVARVSAAESALRLWDGDEYVDLGRLDLGVRRAVGLTTLMARALPRKSVREATWAKILQELAPVVPPAVAEHP